MNALIDEIYATRKVRDAQDERLDAFPHAIPYDEGKAMYDLVRATGAQRTLEIGMAYGLSSLFMCQALRDNGGGHHTAMDPWQSNAWASIGVLNVERAGFNDFFRFYESTADDILPLLLRQGEQFDFVFIDGGHLFDYTLLEFFYADKMIPVGGLVMLDDLWMPSIQKVLEFVLANRNYEFAPEFSPPPKTGLARQLRSARYMLKQLRPGQVVARSPLDYYYGFGATTRWCVLRKTADDARDWQHFQKF